MTVMAHSRDTSSRVEPLLSRWWRTSDRWTLGAIVLLFLTGLFLGYAASPPLAMKNGESPFHYVQKQAGFGFIGVMAVFAMSMIGTVAARRVGIFIFLAAFVGLLLLPFFGTDFGKGAVRWFSFGFVSLQPSEFLKPGLAVILAFLISGIYEEDGPPGWPLSLGLTVAVVFLLAMQPDYGQASILLCVWSILYFVSGAPLLMLILAGLSIVGAGLWAYGNSAHFAGRIDSYLSGDAAANSQIGYSLSAFREGGWFGVGTGDGTIKFLLPDAYTDFIIAAAAEEYGLLIAVFLILLYCTIIGRSLRRLKQERDPFIRLAGVGLTSLIGIQAAINLGVSVQLFPAKGMTLPFVSYGGSSMLATGLTFGMLLAFTRTRPQDDLQDFFPHGR